MLIGDVPPNLLENFLRRLRIEVCSSYRTLLDESWDFDLCSPFWRLYVNNRSGAFIVVSGRRQPLRPGRVCLVPAWLRFQTGTARPVIQEYLHFRLLGLPPAVRGVFRGPIFLPFESALEGVRRQWSGGLEEPLSLSHRFWASSLAHGAIASALRQQEGGQIVGGLEETAFLQPALECLDSALQHPPSNADLARLCHLSEDHFIRKFRQVLGLTPARYSRERRIAAAADWLAGGDRTLDDIAEAAGFTDRFHFSRVFRQRLGLPPAAYRRMHGRESGRGRPGFSIAAAPGTAP